MLHISVEYLVNAFIYIIALVSVIIFKHVNTRPSSGQRITLCHF